MRRHTPHPPPEPPHMASGNWHVNDELARADGALRAALLDVTDRLARVLAEHPGGDTQPVTRRLARYTRELAELDAWRADRERYRTACQRSIALTGEVCPE